MSQQLTRAVRQHTTSECREHSWERLRYMRIQTDPRKDPSFWCDDICQHCHTTRRVPS